MLAGEEGGQCLEENPRLVYSLFLKLLFYHQICTRYTCYNKDKEVGQYLNGLL